MEIAIRHYFSLNHLAAANVMARQCAEIEADQSRLSTWPASNHTNQACAIGALISSVAFLEATINEVFCDCAERTSPHGDVFPNAEILAALWSQGIPRTAAYSVLEKFRIALERSGCQPMDPGISPVQDVDALVFARNFLIHFEPEFVRSTSESEKARFQKIHSRLRSRFELNKLAPVHCMFFPEKALGAGCATWAVRSALEFTDCFFRLAGIKATYDHLRAEEPYSFLHRPAR